MAYKKSTNYYEAAKRISFDDIFDIAGNWERTESTVDGTTVITHSNTVQETAWAFEHTFDTKTGEESEWILCTKGGPIDLPVPKDVFIRDFLFIGNESDARAWVANNANEPQPWLTVLGEYSRAEARIDHPIFDSKALVAELAADQKIHMEAAKLAKELLEEEAHLLEGEPPSAKSLDEWLLEDDEVEEFRIQDVWVKGATVFVVAPNKTGKTTLMCNVIKSLVDGDPFLGKYETNPVKRNIAVVNYELSDKQFRRWMQKLNVTNTEKVKVFNLRGKLSVLRSERARRKFAETLKSMDIEVLIVDPFSSAYPGEDENKNPEVKKFLLRLDAMLAEGGVEEFMMMVHAGHDRTRARGASALADHPDTSWFLNKTGFNQQRTFRAEGRDVFVEEEAISLGEDCITYTLTGKSKSEASSEVLKERIFEFIRDNPNCTAGEIEAAITGKNGLITALRNKLVKEGRVIESLVKGAKRFTAAS